MSLATDALKVLRPLTDSIIVKPLGIKDERFWLEIEGAKYAFVTASKTPIADIAAQFMELLPAGTSQALTWLRANTKEVSSPQSQNQVQGQNYTGTAAGADALATTGDQSGP